MSILPGALFSNATCTFDTESIYQIKGFSVVRHCQPDFSAADLSSRITYVAAKQCIDMLTLRTLDATVLKYIQGDTGMLTMTAKTADGKSDLTFMGPATVLGVEGNVQFAEVESMCTITFAIISSDGQSPDMTAG